MSVKLSERILAMLGLDSPLRIDAVQLLKAVAQAQRPRRRPADKALTKDRQRDSTVRYFDAPLLYIRRSGRYACGRP
jgi:hypothetical protein